MTTEREYLVEFFVYETISVIDHTGALAGLRERFVKEFKLLDGDRCLWDDDTKPGEGKYGSDDGRLSAILYRCPGCGEPVSCDLKPTDRKPSWEMTGTKEKPTLNPSIIHDKKLGGCGWHGYLTDGVFRPC